jgi:hypothetical protein
MSFKITNLTHQAAVNQIFFVRDDQDFSITGKCGRISAALGLLRTSFCVPLYFEAQSSGSEQDWNRLALVNLVVARHHQGPTSSGLAPPVSFEVVLRPSAEGARV